MIWPIRYGRLSCAPPRAADDTLAERRISTPPPLWLSLLSLLGYSGGWTDVHPDDLETARRVTRGHSMGEQQGADLTDDIESVARTYNIWDPKWDKEDPYPTLREMQRICPVAHSD